MNPAVHVYQNLNDLLEALAQIFISVSEKARRANSLSAIALPGGHTPRALFEYLALPQISQKISWEYVQFFWGDERCVPPDHPDSNYGMAQKYLINHINMPAAHIHRIHGENDPHSEAIRYSQEISSSVKKMLSSIPRLDWILLGLGKDGHTASLFTGQSPKGLCGVTFHPKTGQKRITMNYELISLAHRISFIVRGKNKAKMVSKVLKEANILKNIPAANIRPVSGTCEWYLDEAAASYL